MRKSYIKGIVGFFLGKNGSKKRKGGVYYAGKSGKVYPYSKANATSYYKGTLK